MLEKTAPNELLHSSNKRQKSSVRNIRTPPKRIWRLLMTFKMNMTTVSMRIDRPAIQVASSLYKKRIEKRTIEL